MVWRMEMSSSAAKSHYLFISNLIIKPLLFIQYCEKLGDEFLRLGSLMRYAQ